MEIKARFNEGWVMLLRDFDFAELTCRLNKLSFVYVYGHSTLYTRVLNKKGLDKINAPLTPMQKNLMALHDKFGSYWGDDETDDFIRIDEATETEQIYRGEKAYTVIEGEKCFFYPEEYSIVNPREIFKTETHLGAYRLQVEDPHWNSSKEIRDQIHYLNSRGIKKELAEKVVGFTAKHNVWYKPGEELIKEFEGIEPLQQINYNRH